MIKKMKSVYFHLGFFYHSILEFGPKIATDNLLLVFTKWFIGAETLKATYKHYSKKKK